MAEVKIPDLPAASALDGSEVVEIVQDGASKKSTTAQVATYAGVALLASGKVREMLAASRTYYVRTDGDDGNDGLTDSAGGAFLTIQAAVNAAAALDSVIYDVTIQVGAGTRTNAVTLKDMAGAGSITIVGDTTTPGNCVQSTTSADCFYAANLKTKYIIKGFTLQTTTSGVGINVFRANVDFYNIDFGACATAHIWVEQGYVSAKTNYTISGGSTRHWFATNGGVISAANFTITITGTPAFSSAFAIVSRVASILASGNTFSGSATGTRGIATLNGIVDIGGGSASYLPGNSAYVTATGGQIA